VGLTAVTVGVAYVNWSPAEMAEVPLILVTVISTASAACPGATAVISVAE
jgi:hypothetical protein